MQDKFEIRNELSTNLKRQYQTGTHMQILSKAHGRRQFIYWQTARKLSLL